MSSNKSQLSTKPPDKPSNHRPPKPPDKDIRAKCNCLSLCFAVHETESTC